MGLGRVTAATLVACSAWVCAASHGFAAGDDANGAVAPPPHDVDVDVDAEVAADTGADADVSAAADAGDAGDAAPSARMDPPALAPDASVPPAPPPAPPPPALPWSLRPPGVANVVRLDTAFGFHEGGTDVAATLLAMAKLAPGFGALVRTGAALSVVPGDATGALGNVVLGLYGAPNVLPNLRITMFLATSIPSGSTGATGGPAYRTQGAGAAARGFMDGMIFSPNFAAIATGIGVAYLHPSGFTVVWEATAFALGVVRNEAQEADKTRFNLTTGLHVGFSVPLVSGGLEVRYQRWLSDVAAAMSDPSRVDALSIGIGLRGNVRLAKDVMLRPGIAAFEPVDDPLSAKAYHFVVFDVPCSF